MSTGSTSKKKIYSKTKRLQDSISNYRIILQISEEKMIWKKSFAQEKLKIMKLDSEARKHYQDQKLKHLDNYASIAAELKELRQHIVDKKISQNC